MRYFTLILLSTIGFFVYTSVKKAEPTISGLWSEHWVDSDIDYIDTLKIVESNNLLSISLHNLQEDWHPLFYNVKFDGAILSFQMDANHITNFYLFQLSDDQQKFVGKVYTWQGDILKVYLQKEP